MSTVLVTGANRGIGLEFCRQFKERGNNIIAVCRNSHANLDALDVRVETGVDVTDTSSLHKLRKSLSGVKIDTLINNAGILMNETIDNLDIGDIRKQFEVNALGPLNTVDALLPLLSAAAKIILITSRMGSISDNTSGAYYGYRMSKAALNMAGVSLACDLKERGLAVALLHPGYVQTEMTGHSGSITPADSVKDMLARIDQLTLKNSGSFWHGNGEVLGW